MATEVPNFHPLDACVGKKGACNFLYKKIKHDGTPYHPFSTPWKIQVMDYRFHVVDFPGKTCVFFALLKKLDPNNKKIDLVKL